MTPTGTDAASPTGSTPPDSRTTSAASLRERWATLSCGLLAVALCLSRRPDAVTNPQFWAEDGHFWFADAYDGHGVAALLSSHSGYVQSLPRLVGLLAAPLGLGPAPAIFVAVALVVQLFPVLLVLSPRYAFAAPLWVRGILALGLVALPSAETHANLTNSQWWLALAAALVVAAPPSRRLAWRLVDLIVVALCGATGPFAVVLAPLVTAIWWRRRDLWTGVLAATTSALAAVQLAVVLTTSGADRSPAPLGASPTLASRIVAERIVAPVLRGERGGQGLTTAWPHPTAIAILLTVAWLVLVAAALLWGPVVVRILVVLAAATLALALAHPQIALDQPQWPLLLSSTGGERYTLLPLVATLAAVVWSLSRLPRRCGIVLAVALTAVFGTGAAQQWTYPPYVDYHPDREAQLLDAAPRGQTLTLPVNPPGWTMTLERR